MSHSVKECLKPELQPWTTCTCRASLTLPLREILRKPVLFEFSLSTWLKQPVTSLGASRYEEAYNGAGSLHLYSFDQSTTDTEIANFTECSRRMFRVRGRYGSDPAKKLHIKLVM